MSNLDTPLKSVNITQIENFLSRNQSNTWLTVNDFTIHVRKGLHCVGKTAFYTFDISNIDKPELTRGNGEFWNMIDQIAKLLRTKTITDRFRSQIWLKGIYIENVLNERLIKSLPRKGFIELPHQEDPPSFILFI